MSKAKTVSLNLIQARGVYGDATQWMISKGTYTRAQLVTFLNEECGKSIERGLATISPAEATATILLTPRLTSNRGDIRGNVNNPWGHLAYNEKLARRVIDGEREPQCFQFMMRSEALKPLRRKEVNSRRTKLDSTKTEDMSGHAVNANVDVEDTSDVHADASHGTPSSPSSSSAPRVQS